jgi:hypothetical protein
LAALGEYFLFLFAIICLSDVYQIDDEKCNDDSRKAKSKHIADVMSGYALPRTHSWNNRLLRSLPIGILVLRGSRIAVH